MRHRILLTGASGLIGPYLVDTLSTIGQVVPISNSQSRSAGDLTRMAEVRRALEESWPSLVVHAAALTNVEECERDPIKAFAVNGGGTENLVKALPPGARIVYVSTDQVYADTPGPHVEWEACASVNNYGRSKLAGEAAALRSPESLVLRINFFGPSRTRGRVSLSDFFIESLNSNRKTQGYINILFNPLHMLTVGELLIRAIEARLSGVFNAGSRDGASKYAFGVLLAEHLGLNAGLIDPVRYETGVNRVARPKDMRMDVKMIETALGITMPSLFEEVQKL